MLRILAALLVSFVALSSSHAASIRVRTECGFFYAMCGEPAVTLEQNGATYEFLMPTNYDGPLSYSLAYLDDEFVMTALNDNLLWGGNSPFGLAIYPGSGPMRTRLYSDSTAYGYVFMNAFPRGEGSTWTLAIPAAEVPEPQTVLLLLGGLAALGWSRRRPTRVTA